MDVEMRALVDALIAIRETNRVGYRALRRVILAVEKTSS